MDTSVHDSTWWFLSCGVGWVGVPPPHANHLVSLIHSLLTQHFTLATRSNNKKCLWNEAVCSHTQSLWRMWEFSPHMLFPAGLPILIHNTLQLRLSSPPPHPSFSSLFLTTPTASADAALFSHPLPSAPASHHPSFSVFIVVAVLLGRRIYLFIGTSTGLSQNGGTDGGQRGSWRSCGKWWRE